MTQAVCKVMGAMLLLLGFVGFAEPNLLGMHLNTAHNVFHILSGTAALCVGFAGPPSAARRFSVAFGSAYLVLGVLGFALPRWVGLLIGHGEGVNAAALVPDNVVHVLLGGVFLLVGLRTPAGAPRSNQGRSAVMKTRLTLYVTAFVAAAAMMFLGGSREASHTQPAKAAAARR